MLSRRTLMWLAGIFPATRPALGQVPSNDLPREQLLIPGNPEGAIEKCRMVQHWAINARGRTTGLHQNVMENFWHIDPDLGIDGVWDNSLATGKPVSII
ncbi:hypothetical protein [Neorhizobium sp. LjRoot104]|uniref:hypothetical protein n=1 Tax=Neorhizobium sp. LjRoot104 TaxID=3342254 RepID=UPI003ECD545D